jgi:hypothetical protein
MLILLILLNSIPKDWTGYNLWVDTLFGVTTDTSVFTYKSDSANYWLKWRDSLGVWKADSCDTADFAHYADHSEYLWEYDISGSDTNLMPSEVVISGDLWIMDFNLNLMPTKNDSWHWDKYWEYDINGDLIPK